jgi:hypothetical protein
METFEFLGLNFIIVASVLLCIVIYLIFLIRKRQKDKFLHQSTKEPE